MTAKRTFDVFPANVVITSANYYPENEISAVFPSSAQLDRSFKYVDTARVIAANDFLYIAVDSVTGPVLFFREGFSQQHADGRVTRFVTNSGRVIAVKKDKSCGCGSRLKNWYPLSSSNQDSVSISFQG